MRGESSVQSAELDMLDLEMPEVDADLRACQAAAGCIEFSAEGVPMSFGNDEDALWTLAHGAVLVDRSHWGRFRISGEDRASFLHGQSTADITALSPGQGCDTVFVTAQGRCVDLATCLIQPSGILVTVSPGMAQPIMLRLEKFILYGDKVELTDIASRTAMLTLAGPTAADVLTALGADDAAAMQPGQHTLLQASASPIVVAATRTFGERDFTLIVDEAVAGDLWKSLTAKGAVAMGETAWQQACIKAGRPRVGIELTEAVTPLEAGLYGAVSLAKGCYIGQETLAKVHMKGIAKQLIGVRLSAPAAPGNAVTEGGNAIGKIVSVQGEPSGRAFALAYVRCRSKGVQIPLAGTAVQVNDATGELVEVPALQREFRPEHAPQLAAREKAQPSSDDSDSKSAEEAAKAERLQQMQERLAAWQAQQQ